MRLNTEKDVDENVGSGSGQDVVRTMAKVEKSYQEEMNRAFVSLSEGAFKGLRRQLPVTRQKVEWEKISSYRVSAVFAFFLPFINSSLITFLYYRSVRGSVILDSELFTRIPTSLFVWPDAEIPHAHSRENCPQYTQTLIDEFIISY